MPLEKMRYSLKDRPPWWPAATDYSATAIRSLTRKDIEFLHSSVIGAMKEECPELLFAPSELEMGIQYMQAARLQAAGPNITVPKIKQLNPESY